MSDDVDPWDDPAVLEQEALDWAIGPEPDWYYPLVGRVAVAAGNLELEAVVTALVLQNQPTLDNKMIYFWLSSTARMETLFELVKGQNAEFDQLVSRLKQARGRRNAIVHVSVDWNEFETPDEPGGWHYRSPRGGSVVYLTDEVRDRMEADLGVLRVLRKEFWELTTQLYRDRSQR